MTPASEADDLCRCPGRCSAPPQASLPSGSISDGSRLSLSRQSTTFYQAPRTDSPKRLAMLKSASVAIRGLSSLLKVKSVSSVVA